MRGMRTGETPIQYAERLLEQCDQLSRELVAQMRRAEEMLRWKDDNERLRKHNERLKRALREYGRPENWQIPTMRGPVWRPDHKRVGIPAWEDPTHIANLALGRYPGSAKGGSR